MMGMLVRKEKRLQGDTVYMWVCSYEYGKCKRKVNIWKILGMN